ncbi:hypothetical protein [Symbioplanes lichenis]|uniref:hypothetical protein n=1 Tax=Symbioplanes lichenis TaxID=1629072 RepID=UPI002739A47E|nr:hypothetical protein [Actinoplanes lichenis]
MPEKNFWTDDGSALKAARLLLAAIDDAEGRGQDDDDEFELLNPIEQGRTLVGLVELSIYLAYKAYGSNARSEIAGVASLIEAVGVRTPPQD